MPKTKKELTKEDLAVSAVSLAGDLGWSQVRFQDLAREADISLSEVARMFDDKSCLLVTYGRYLDRRTLEETGEIDRDSSPRERLFDILMTRFDVLNEQRAGVVSVLESFKIDPKQVLISLPHLSRSMMWMLEAAGIGTDGLRGLLKIAGLKLIYLKVLKTWKEDDGPDMPKTMAELDQLLGRAESFAERFGG
ncbi:MAG: TetR family transcriptional regulator [Rhodospirillales bacterium]|nr:TetR family transcriptional regulator [Rhodospirillales bacterium]MCB9972987.1 TetR family transcriptional regulator [Rhodospirillales bacterium]MCB9980025.1 TetR family transcriptional regulator [Rhodospirillales bacterium]